MSTHFLDNIFKNTSFNIHDYLKKVDQNPLNIFIRPQKSNCRHLNELYFILNVKKKIKNNTF